MEWRFLTVHLLGGPGSIHVAANGNPPQFSFWRFPRREEIDKARPPSCRGNDKPTSKPPQDLLNVRCSRDAMTKITDVHIDQLLPSQGSRTSLRRSQRSRKQNQPGSRRLRSERYPYQ